MAESIFPFMDPEEEEVEDNIEVSIAKEWAWDFDNEEFKTRNGRMYLVEGKEAVKIWLWKLFKTIRFRELIYNWDYGHELDELIGLGFTKGYLNSEAERYVKEAIEYNLGEYVTDIEDFEVDFEVDFKGSTLSVKFKAITIYGGLEVRTNV